MNLFSNQFLICLISVLVLFSSCSNEARHSYKDVEFEELFIPLILDSSSFEMSLKYIFPVKVDSVFSEDYYLSFESNAITAIKPKGKPPTLSNIIAYIKGIPFGLAAYYSTNTSVYSKDNRITFNQIEGGQLRFAIDDNKKCLAYWNCIPLKITQNGNETTVPIPPFAKYTDNSHITIASIDNKGALSLAVTPLRKGKYVDYKKLRKEAVVHSENLAFEQIRKTIPSEYLPLLNQYFSSQIDSPASVSSLYGIYTIEECSDSLCVLLSKYFAEEQKVILNNSSEAVKYRTTDSLFVIPPKYHSIFITSLDTN